MTRFATSALGAAALAVVTLGAPAAQAADDASTELTPAPTSMTSEVPKAAAEAADSSLTGAFLDGLTKAPDTHMRAQALKAEDEPKETKATGSPVAVYVLNPQFVRDGSGPVGRFSYAATPYTLRGVPATIDTVQKDGEWVAANISTGTTEQDMAKAAKGADLLYEPQVHAWYAVDDDDTLRPLNDSAKKAIGKDKDSISRDDYAAQVHAKYASMMPGSSYAKSGKAGGFQAAPVQIKAASSGTTESFWTGSATKPAVAASLSIGAVALGGIALRRRRASRVGREI